MKKFAVLALALSAMFTLTACGSKADAPAPESTVEASTEASTEATTEESTEEAAPAEVTVEAPDADTKVGKLADEKGTTTATVTFADGKPVSVVFDYINEDGSSKYEAAKAGEYVMSETGTPWNEQVDALAAFLAENNFDLSAVTLTDEEGHTDAVTGVSIKIPALLQVVEAVINN